MQSAWLIHCHSSSGREPLRVQNSLGTWHRSRPRNSIINMSLASVAKSTSTLRQCSSSVTQWFRLPATRIPFQVAVQMPFQHGSKGGAKTWNSRAHPSHHLEILDTASCRQPSPPADPLETLSALALRPLLCCDLMSASALRFTGNATCFVSKQLSGLQRITQ